MEQLFSEVILCIQNPLDVNDALRILAGDLTVAAAAETRGQGNHFFHGDADVLVLSFSTACAAANESKSVEAEAKEALANVDPNEIFQQRICPALATSETSLEFVVRYCNLSTETVIGLSDAIRLNSHLVGFTLVGNPGDSSDMGLLALKYACIHSRAPIMYFQGRLLDQAIIDLREEAAEVDSIDMDQDHPRSDTLDTIQTTMTAVSTPIAMKRNTRSPTWLSKSPRDEPKPRYCRRVATEPCMGKQPSSPIGDDDDFHAQSWRPQTINWMKLQ